MTLTTLLLASSLGLAPAAPAAPAQTYASGGQNFTYRYVDLQYAFGDIDGVRLRGAYQLDEPWIAVAKAEFTDASDDGVDVDLLAVSGGFGYVYPLQEKLDLVGTAELEYGSVDVSSGSVSDSDSELGLRARGGARYRVTPEFEAYGGATLRTIFDSTFQIDGGARYHLDERLALTAGLEFGDDTIFAVGVRYSF